MLMLISVFVALADFPISYLPQSGCQYLLTNFINSVGKWFCIAQQNDWWSVFLCINFQAKYIFRKKRSWMLRMGWDEKDGVKGYKCMNGVAGSTLSWADTSHCPSRLPFPPSPPLSHQPLPADQDCASNASRASILQDCKYTILCWPIL